MTAIKSEPPNPVWFTWCRQVTNAVLFVVLAAEIAIGQSSMAIDLDDLIMVFCEPGMTFENRNITAPISHPRIPANNARQPSRSVFPLDFVRFRVPWIFDCLHRLSAN
jgi:hypothetical protein